MYEKTHESRTRRWLLCTYLNGGTTILIIAPEAKFDEEAGGGGEGARQAQAKLLHQCKKTEEMKDGNTQECETMQEDE